MDKFNLFLQTQFALQLVGAPGAVSQFGTKYATWLYGWKEEGATFIAVAPGRAQEQAMKDLAALGNEILVWRVPPHFVRTPDGLEHLRFRCHHLTFAEMRAYLDKMEPLRAFAREYQSMQDEEETETTTKE